MTKGRCHFRSESVEQVLLRGPGAATPGSGVFCNRFISCGWVGSDRFPRPSHLSSTLSVLKVMSIQMNESLIDVGKLSEPATVLVERISDAVGGFFKPYQIKRVARAEAEARKIKAEAELEVSELQERALNRFVAEEARKQKNIEEIGSAALGNVANDADPEEIEEDWIVNFFDKCRLISDDEMQSLWSRVLSGEANQPGAYSKRTVNFLSSMDKQDAEIFTTLCRFTVNIDYPISFIYTLEDGIYERSGLNFEKISHLDDIGLVSYSGLSGFKVGNMPQNAEVDYFGKPLILMFPDCDSNEFSIGKVRMSSIGKELASVCDPDPVDGFTEYVAGKWAEENIRTSVPIEFESEDV